MLASDFSENGETIHVTSYASSMLTGLYRLDHQIEFLSRFGWGRAREEFINIFRNGPAKMATMCPNMLNMLTCKILSIPLTIGHVCVSLHQVHVVIYCYLSFVA